MKDEVCLLAHCAQQTGRPRTEYSGWFTSIASQPLINRPVPLSITG